MKQKAYGLGFSPLSFKNAKSYGFNEEIVANKDVGMYGVIADDSKNVISHEYLARTKYHLNSFTTRLLQDSTVGKLYKITIGDSLATRITNNTTDLIDGSLIKINNGTKRMRGVRFNFDIDIFAPVNSALIHFKEISILIKMTLRVGAMSKQLTIEDSALAINTTAYHIDFSGLEDATGDVELQIDSVIIKPPSDFDYSHYRIMLYDILFVVI